ncbi:oxidative damage protection protein [Blochmannia endosymbiont of Colobopsis nipponica]|uniref:oxidative damage protection protein n=1 Tax=Blochmannia endosymbiont of Colobopsis nipponica TaxID=2681987 RepID=UPI0017802991|nr:oxidative damage protection protein [Blochmannia endosymbiont of Colobopsis nipponica]QOI11179.1 oxidative damage protection protein [Blochmannia endosymbiont of Colobopsis nipponica]
MKRIIYCTFLKRKAEGLKIKLYPGKIGEEIYQKISQEAWNKWQTKQTIIINEKKLDMSNPAHRNFLESEMINFLFYSK